jgi:integrase
MRKHHSKNELVKHQYAAFLEEAKRMSPSTVDQTMAAIALFEETTGHRDLGTFRIEQARKFERRMDEAISPGTGRPLAKATVYSRLMALKAFFQWLALQPGYRSKITYSDADYFNPSNHDGRIAKASMPRPTPSLDQSLHGVTSMPAGTELEKRDRALIAFAILSGARDDAIASMKIRHVDLERRTVFHDAREVRTKNRKTHTSTFFPVGNDFEEMVTDWVSFLKTGKQFGPDDPLFPATKIAVGPDGLFGAVGLDRAALSNAGPIRRIFRQAFERTGLPYFHPHSFRRTLAAWGERLCQTPEDFKAWSQNLAHEGVLTTFSAYGAVAPRRQAEIIDGMRWKAGSGSGDRPLDHETVAKVIAMLRSGAAG